MLPQLLTGDLPWAALDCRVCCHGGSGGALGGGRGGEHPGGGQEGGGGGRVPPRVIHDWGSLRREGARVGADSGGEEGLLVCSLPSSGQRLRLGQEGTGQQISVLGGQHDQLGSHLGHAQAAQPHLLPGGGGQQLRQELWHS